MKIHALFVIFVIFIKWQNLKLSSVALYGLNHLSDVQIIFLCSKNGRIIILWCSKELSCRDSSFEHPKHIL